MQPTDLVSGRFSCFRKAHGDREEDERVHREKRQGLVETMKLRLYRLFITLSAIGTLALAGGASVKGW